MYSLLPTRCNHCKPERIFCESSTRLVYSLSYGCYKLLWYFSNRRSRSCMYVFSSWCSASTDDQQPPQTLQHTSTPKTARISIPSQRFARSPVRSYFRSIRRLCRGWWNCPVTLCDPLEFPLPAASAAPPSLHLSLSHSLPHSLTPRARPHSSTTSDRKCTASPPAEFWEKQGSAFTIPTMVKSLRIYASDVALIYYIIL